MASDEDALKKSFTKPKEKPIEAVEETKKSDVTIKYLSEVVANLQKNYVHRMVCINIEGDRLLLVPYDPFDLTSACFLLDSEAKKQLKEFLSKI